jgi:deoxyribodipyrimidine photolyase-related protein
MSGPDPRPLHFVGPWDLDRGLACWPARPEDGPVLLVESVGRSRALPFHRQKLALVLAAQRHAAAEARAAGFTVEIRRARTYAAGIRAAVAARGSTKVIALEAPDHGIDQALRAADLGAPLELRPDGGPGGRFLLSREEVRAWGAGRRTLRMDLFYAWMRKRFGVLMEGGAPVGGVWSFDKENRKVPRGERPPAPVWFAPDPTTEAALAEVESWGIGWGALRPFGWPVTRAQALDALQRFIGERLPRFGDFEDAMVDGQAILWHAALSPALNLGLLRPMECVQAAVDAYTRGAAPLNAVEGFVRQILGWREFIRAAYLLRMPAMRAANALDAHEPLPGFFWAPEQADMACVRAAVAGVHDRGYAHHIQRLMVLGNLCLLVGVEPLALSRWFWAAFVDGFEWVELPNVHGMALYADTALTTKPYAASGAYIDRMSDHCRGCRYDVKQRTGAGACPYNPLFWDFLDRHRPRFAGHPRLGALYGTFDRFPPAEQDAIRSTAAALRARFRAAPSPAWSFDDDAG